MTDKPTPKEIDDLVYELRQAGKDDTYSLARAVLAKWGQPAQETKGRKVFVCTHCDGVYADQPVTRCDCLPDENTFTEGWICFGAPAQAAESVPAVDEVADRYRNAIASACEGWTMPDGLRKHLETALWSPPTSQPTQAQAAEPVAWLDPWTGTKVTTDYDAYGKQGIPTCRSTAVRSEGAAG